ARPASGAADSYAGTRGRRRRPRRARRASQRPAGESPAASPRLPVSVAVATTAALTALASTLGDVRQQGKLPRALDCAGDLALMTPARAGDPPGADLAALGDESAQSRDVLVVDLLHLVAAVRARLPTSGGQPTLPVAPARRPSTLLCHRLPPDWV